MQDALSPAAELAARAVVGLFLMPHGAQKLFGLFGGYGLEGTEQILFERRRETIPAAFAMNGSLSP